MDRITSGNDKVKNKESLIQSAAENNLLNKISSFKINLSFIFRNPDPESSTNNDSGQKHHIVICIGNFSFLT